MVTKIDHIGIAVRSIAEARLFYEQVLGLVCEGEETVTSQRVNTAFFTVGDVHIELLEPTDETSPLAQFLAKKGEGIHHIAYQCGTVEGQLQKAAKQGCTLIHEKPIPGAGGKEIAFLHPRSTFGVLTEFCSVGKGSGRDQESLSS